MAVIGMTSYPWLVTYFGTVGSGTVCVPLDVSLPMEEMCELVHRSDASVLVVDEIRKDVMLAAKAKCPKLKYVISNCSYLIAARTHASIAGYSSLVPIGTWRKMPPAWI